MKENLTPSFRTAGKQSASRIQPALLSLAVQLRGFRIQSGGGRMTVITPAGPGFECGAIVMGLSEALEQIHEGPVLVIHCEVDAENRQPCNPSTGEDLVVTLQAANLDSREVLPIPERGKAVAGGLDHLRFSSDVNVAAEVSSPGFLEFIDQASERFRHILVSTGYHMRNAETAILAQMSDYAVLTVAKDHTTLPQIRGTLALLRRNSATTLGFLLETEPQFTEESLA